MARKLLKSYLPDPHKLQNSPWLRIFGRYLTDPKLWRLHRRSVATAFSIGLFVTYIPIPGHMIMAVLSAIMLRANLPVAIALSWVVNPVTVLPMFGFAYSLGAYLLGIPLSDLHFEWSVLKDIWMPLFLGCFICGSTLAITGNLGIRFYWRYSVAKAWKNRNRTRLTPHLPTKPSDPSVLPM